MATPKTTEEMKSNTLTIGGITAILGIAATVIAMWANASKETRARNDRILQEDRQTQTILTRLKVLEDEVRPIDELNVFSKEEFPKWRGEVDNVLNNIISTEESTLRELSNLEERLENDEEIDGNHRLTVFPEVVKELEGRLALTERGVRENSAQIVRNGEDIVENTDWRTAQANRATRRVEQHEQRDVRIAENKDLIFKIDEKINGFISDGSQGELRDERIKEIKKMVDTLVDWRNSQSVGRVELLQDEVRALRDEMSRVQEHVKMPVDYGR